MIRRPGGSSPGAHSSQVPSRRPPRAGRGCGGSCPDHGGFSNVSCVELTPGYKSPRSWRNRGPHGASVHTDPDDNARHCHLGEVGGERGTGDQAAWRLRRGRHCAPTIPRGYARLALIGQRPRASASGGLSSRLRLAGLQGSRRIPASTPHSCGLGGQRIQEHRAVGRSIPATPDPRHVTLAPRATPSSTTTATP